MIGEQYFKILYKVCNNIKYLRINFLNTQSTDSNSNMVF